MSKALNEVMNYANEDEVSIYKHWIVFLKAAISSVLTSTIIFVVGFLISRRRFNISLILLLIAVIICAVRFFGAYGQYRSTILTINNIRIYGETGLSATGSINSPLDRIVSTACFSSFWGKQFGYGSIKIVLENQSFELDDMVNVVAFSEAVILLQKAQEEAARIRQDERNDQSRQNAAAIGAQATIEGAKLQAQLQTELLENVLDGLVNKLAQVKESDTNLLEKKQSETPLDQ